MDRSLKCFAGLTYLLPSFPHVSFQEEREEVDLPCLQSPPRQDLEDRNTHCIGYTMYIYLIEISLKIEITPRIGDRAAVLPQIYKSLEWAPVLLQSRLHCVNLTILNKLGVNRWSVYRLDDIVWLFFHGFRCLCQAWLTVLLTAAKTQPEPLAQWARRKIWSEWYCNWQLRNQRWV